MVDEDPFDFLGFVAEDLDSLLFRPATGGVDDSGASTRRGTGELEVSASALLEPMVIFSPPACLLAPKYDLEP